MQQLHAIKLIYDNGIMENVDQGIVLIHKKDGMEFEAVNMLPDSQLLLTAITLHQLVQEHLEGVEDSDVDELTDALMTFIKALLNPTYKSKNKGDVLQ